MAEQRLLHDRFEREWLDVERQVGVGGLGVGEQLVEELAGGVDAPRRRLEVPRAGEGVVLAGGELQVSLCARERGADVVGEGRQVALELPPVA